MFFQIEDWRQYLKQGEKYLNTAVKAAAKRPEVFTPAILYNLSAMAIEKLIMGYLMSRGDLAENHTMADLLQALERHIELPADLARDLLCLDSFQEICDMDTFSIKKPMGSDIAKMLTIGDEVKRFIFKNVYSTSRLTESIT